MSGRVLIIDPDPNEIGAVSARLREAGYDTVIASKGRSALRKIAEAPPDVVVMSTELTDVDALEVCSVLGSDPVARHIPVILLSSSSDIQTKIDALSRGAVDFVPRPVDPAEILARVERQATVSRIRAALEQSEAEFQSVTRSAIDAIVSANSEGRIRSWNPAAARLFGFSEEEILGEDLSRIIPERFRSAHHEGIRRVSGGGPSRVIGNTVEVSGLRQDGKEVPVELSLATWTLAGERYYTGILRDISERKEAEQKFRSVTDSAIDAIVSADDSSTVIGWNKAAEEIFGWSAEEIIGEPIETIIPERYREAHRAGMERMTTTGESRVIGQTVELQALHRDGHELPIELSLSTWLIDQDRYYTGILRDISERKEAEQKFRSVTDSAIDAIVSADDSSTVIGWNKAAEEIFGWSAEEIIGRPLETIIPERYRDAHRAGMDRMTRTGEGRVIGRTVELQALHRDGHELPVELSLSSWMIDQDRYYTGILRDITERKEAEEQLRLAAEKLERQHKRLKRQHRELKASRDALAASYRQVKRLFSSVTDGMPGAVLNDKYRLDEKIASGGFGVVYRATQVTLERTVALKLLRPPSGEDEEEVFTRFRREGVTACRINHLNAVAVLDLDVSEGGFPYIVMEYLEGDTLEERLRSERPLTMRQAAEIFADVCACLRAAHRAGVLHRDIKPSNLFLQHQGEGDGDGDGFVVKVLDFGVARLMDDPGRFGVTHTGALLGTPSYMAPERLRIQASETAASDVYAVGVALFRTLSGALPFPPQNDLIQTIRTQLRTNPLRLSYLRPAVPEPLSSLVERALDKEPDNRPTAAEMETELRGMVGGLPLEDVDGGPPDPDTILEATTHWLRE